MKNFEKFEKEIKELNYKFAVTKNNTLCECAAMICDKCKFNHLLDWECQPLKTKWLYEEYREPILTDKEKEYLKIVIKPFEQVDYIIKGDIDLMICHSEDGYSTLSLDYGYDFDGLERAKKYTLKELGLED